MPNDFPHISDTTFPILDNVNPYKYENTFDYTQYDNMQMKITVCKVPWDVGLIHVGNAQIGGLGNVVMFESKEARDEWFAGLEDVYTWHTKYRKYHTDGFIEVPLPYEKCVLYNYVHVEFEPLPVDYAEGGKEHFFFFIRSCESLAPSCCKIEILRDTWQTFIYDIDIAYMMLERGHAPMSVIDADTYLANPIENNSYLLAEDVNYGNTYVSRRANEIVLNSGEMWACIVTSSDLSRSFGSFQTTAITPDGQAMQDGQPSMFAYAIAPGSLYAFLTSAKSQVPQFLQTIKAVFFIKREFVQVAGYVTFAGYQLGRLNQDTETINLIDLNKSIFGYTEDYEDIAKLYTYPYAYLEISDETGAVNHVRIEETTGDISLTVTTSLAYPWLCLDGRLSGIGAGGNTVTFANVNGHSFEFAGDWFNYLNRWDIPTFAVNVDAATVYDYETYYDREQRQLELSKNLQNANASADTSYNNAIRSADAAYNNEIRSANTSESNADDSNDTRRANALATALVAKQNADNSALTAKTNADNSASTVKENADNTARTIYLNGMAVNQTDYDNRMRTSTATKDNVNATNSTTRNIASQTAGAASINASNARYYAKRKTERTNQKIDADKAWDVASIAMQAALTADLNLATTIINTGGDAATSAASSAMTGALSGAASGAVAGGPIGALAGVGVSLIGSAASASCALASYAATVSNSQQQVNWEDGYMGAKANIVKNYNINMTDLEHNFNGEQVSVNNSLSIGTTNLATATSDSIAVRTFNTESSNTSSDKHTSDVCTERVYNTAIAANANAYNTDIVNSRNVKNTANDNALNTYNVTVQNTERDYNKESRNIDRTRSTAGQNAANTRSAAQSNASDTRATTRANAQRDYDTGIAGIQAALNQAGLKAPVQFGEFANGETSTTRPIGLFCNVVTQAKDAIEQAGDYFLRFGYAVNRAWKFTTFNLMPHFTYWKCSDIWVHSNNVPDAYMDEIRFFLLGGVCVWNDPDDIGVISIYDN